MSAPADKLLFGSKDHDKLLDWVLDCLRASQQMKKPFEELGLEAYKAFRCTLDPLKHPFPSKVWDPVLSGTLISLVAATADAMFASPPILDYMPEGYSTDEQTRIISAMAEHHLNRLRPRRLVVRGLLGLNLVGTQYWEPYYRRRKTEVGCWIRESVPVTEPDPLTGMPVTTSVDRERYVRQLRTTFEGPAFRTRHITQCYPDASEEELQDGGWWGTRDVLSSEWAKEAAEEEGWDQEITERSLQCDSYAAHAEMGTTYDWLEQIGLSTKGMFRSITDRKAVEVLRFWRRREGRVEKIVVLNRHGVAFAGDSPYGHGQFPAIKQTLYPLDNEHFGVGNYEFVRWQLRGVQTMVNAAASAALLCTMPPALKRRGMEMDKLIYEPAGIVEVDDPGGVKFLEFPQAAVAIGHNEAEALKASMDNALGGSEVNRGALPSDEQSATATNLAYQSAGRRIKFLVDNSDDELIVPLGDFYKEMMFQFQDYGLQLRLKGPKSAPVTVWPEDFRQVECFAVPTAAAETLKAMKEKRMLQLHQLGVSGQEPTYNRNEGWRLVVETIAQNEADRLLLDPNAQPLMPGVQPGAPQGQWAPGFGGNPGTVPGPSGDMHELAGELTEGMDYQ